MERYIYDGPVKEFGRIINSNWYGETVAQSPDAAKRNLMFRYKTENGKARTAKITLPGKLEVSNGR